MEQPRKSYKIGILPENLQRTTIVGDNFYFIFTFSLIALVLYDSLETQWRGLNNIQGRGLAKKHNLTVRANPGATPRDILDHIKPALRKKPDVIIIHCGSNDITSQEKLLKTCTSFSAWQKQNHQTLSLLFPASLRGGISHVFNRRSMH